MQLVASLGLHSRIIFLLYSLLLEILVIFKKIVSSTLAIGSGEYQFSIFCIVPFYHRRSQHFITWALMDLSNNNFIWIRFK